MSNVISLAARRRAEEPVIYLWGKDGSGEHLVELAGVPAIGDSADRRLPDHQAAINYALDLQEEHGFPVVSMGGRP